LEDAPGPKLFGGPEERLPHLGQRREATAEVADDPADHAEDQGRVAHLASPVMAG
jgi:hypothetical protein